jgi:hypothetical protein
MPLASAVLLGQSNEVEGFCPGMGLETILGAMQMSSVEISQPLHR